MGFCKKKDISNLLEIDKFYFHAIEQDNFVQDFPIEILDTKELYLYQGGRGKPVHFTGHYGKIKDIKLKHKSKIKGKENSKTEYYYEVELEENFKLKIKPEKLLASKVFKKNDKRNKEFFRKYLPSISTKEKMKQFKVL